ncbi:unnamed protein product [Chrysodeixis includens]|uniref:WW domain-containing protein n=1 Tax=Chrysodeixis includens TaxID=689277 RepID=A0A9P0C345_CHRIL|nr:unnamed protein product [Chrysodeixis includens]
MNINKKNEAESGWLLCPSKKNPGKFYYFNVVTGESVWTCDADNPAANESNVQKTPVKCHANHEPTDAGPSNTFRPYYRPRSPYVQPVPIYSQPSFSNYAPDQELMPNIIWAPIQLPRFGQEKKPLIDKVTQTSASSQSESEIISKQRSHENLLLSYVGESQIEKPVFRTSTPKKVIVYDLDQDSDLNHSVKPIFSPFTPEKNNHIWTLNVDNKVESAMNEEPNVQKGAMFESLESSDLRLLLIAKRRKTVDGGANGPGEKKVLEVKPPVARKRVTFDMSNIEKVDQSHTVVSNKNNNNTPQKSTNAILPTKPEPPKPISIFTPEIKKYLPDGVQSDTWFLVADTDVLLLDYETIDNVVVNDTKCKLLIPYAVRSDIEALCVGDCQGQQRVKNARQITRRLAAPPQHYILQPQPDDESTILTTESVLKCCFQATTFNHRVILITNDPYLQAKADLLNIKNYKLNDLKYNFNSNLPLTPKKIISGKKDNNTNHVKVNETVVKENSSNSEVKNDNLTYSLFDCDSPINKPKSMKINENDNPTAELSQIVRNIETDASKPVINTLSKNVSNVQKPINSNKNKFEPTSGHVDVSCANDKNNDFNYEILSLEHDFDRFDVKSQIMNEKLTSRMDEWLCTYTQIMEDVLHALLQINSDNMTRTVAPLSLQETFNTIKIVYLDNIKIKIIVKKLTELLDKCTTKIGKLILAPDDFMTILGYGVLLVQELKSIQPLCKELKDAASNISGLLNNIESDNIEDDLEKFTQAPVSRSEYDDRQEIRSNFVKDPSHILDYLRQHYVQWAEYSKEIDDKTEQITAKNDCSILRISGKHLNKLKIDSSKNITLNTNEEINTPKIIKLVDQINIKNQQTDKHIEKLQIPFTDTNKNQTQNINKNVISFTEYKNNQENKINIEGSKITNNLKVIETKQPLRESLDLDALDYSEIASPKHFDIFESNEKIVKNNNNDATISNIDNYLINKQNNVNNKIDEIFEISDDTSISQENALNTCKEKSNQLKDTTHNKNITKINDILNNYNVTPKLNENTPKNYKVTPKLNEITPYINLNTPVVIENTHKVYNNTQKLNDSLITYNITPKFNENVPKNYNVTPKFNENAPKLYDNTPNIANFIENDPKNCILRDDNTNDSGFENDSTYALSAVKIFFSEICSTFRIVHKLIAQFRLLINKGDLSESKKKLFQYQASKSLEHFDAIMQHLKSIIKRESADESVLKGLLLKAGLEASMDKRMTHYRQIAIKFLEQAQILELGLKAVLSITNGSFTAVSTTEVITTAYFNIFE